MFLKILPKLEEYPENWVIIDAFNSGGWTKMFLNLPHADGKAIVRMDEHQLYLYNMAEQLVVEVNVKQAKVP